MPKDEPGIENSGKPEGALPRGRGKRFYTVMGVCAFIGFCIGLSQSFGIAILAAALSGLIGTMVYDVWFFKTQSKKRKLSKNADLSEDPSIVTIDNIDKTKKPVATNRLGSDIINNKDKDFSSPAQDKDQDKEQNVVNSPEDNSGASQKKKKRK